ncbi:MAG: hypothetical protein KatS3mg131_2548 [Candidatus Tectimicrobiota bacterium]|nr:MAG: hypothetical protein KatS3mg131_2548 [Candidatus Tectomicrobia bacterium]
MSSDHVRAIFGMKLRQFRERRGYTLKALAARTGLSPSYLTEIEKGKKYPSAARIMQLAAALGVAYDELVSLKLDQELDSLGAFLASPLLREFPFQLFGVAPHDVLDLITRAPHEASALIRAVGEVASRYDMRVEHLFYAALRSYQEMHHNYFPELEEAAARFVAERGWDPQVPPALEALAAVLTETYGYVLDDTALEAYPELQGLRSVWIDATPPRLLLNRRLLPAQKAFVLGRELGYCYLGLRERAATSSPIEVNSFAQVFNDFKASYFAGALLMNRERVVADLGAFLQRRRWDGKAFLALLARYRATPEMFFYRLSELLPTFLHLPQLHFLRLHSVAGSGVYRLTKHLNMSHLPLPHGIDLHEHYCRRWLAVRLLREFAQRQQQGEGQAPLLGVQRSVFADSDAEYFCLSLARPLALTPGTNTSVTLGFRLDDAFKATVRFWDDPAIPRLTINETCERCWLEACGERAAPPHLFTQEAARQRRHEALARLKAAFGAS